MSTYTDLPPLAKIAEVLGGDAGRFDVLAPGPGHSSADRSLAVRPDENAPDGYLVHSFAGDDAVACKTVCCRETRPEVERARRWWRRA